MKTQAFLTIVTPLALLAGTLTAPATLLIDVDATTLALADGATVTTVANPGAVGEFTTLIGSVETISHPANNNPGASIQGLAFDGDKMTSANTLGDVGMMGNQTYTVMGWVWNAGAGAEETLVSWGHRGGPNGSNSGFHQGIHPNFGAIGHWGGGAIGDPNEPDVGWGNNGADINATFGRWAHLAYVWNGVEDRVYIDGVLSNSEVHIPLAPHQTYADGTPTVFALGSESDAGSVNSAPIPFSGTIARVKVYDTTMTDAEIRAAFDAEKILFFDGVDIEIKTYEDGLGYEIALTESEGTPGGQQFLEAGDTCYYTVQWDVTGLEVASGTFTNRWYLDGNLIHEETNPPDNRIIDFFSNASPPAPPLSAGSHTIEVYLDYFGDIPETDEENNKSTRRFLVLATEGVDFSPLDAANPMLSLNYWSDRVVISTVPGTNTDAAIINSNQRIYIDAIGMNFGPAPSTESFVTRLKLNGEIIPNSVGTVPPGVQQFQVAPTEDVEIGPLPPGEYTLTYEIDPLGTQPEQDESNNSYTRTFTVIPDVIVVTNSNSNGSGSLRQVVEDASSESTVIFDPSLDEQTIPLGGSAIIIDKNLTIDASSLSDGITVSGGNVSRVFFITGGVEVTLDSLTITAGSASLGGGIYVDPGSSVTLRDCTLTGNTASGGGALFSFSPPSNLSVVDLVNCTVTGNSATNGRGGALYTNGTTIRLNHTTIADNSATTLAGGVAGINGSSLVLENSIVAGNRAPTAADIDGMSDGGATISTSGSNLIGDNSTVEAAFSAGPLAGTAADPLDPLLAPLGDYGGPARTMLPFSSSPAIDAAVVLASTPATDQRGLARVVGGAPDLGAYESGNAAGYAVWAVEMIPAGLDATFDGDAEDDKSPNGVEYALGTRVLVSDPGSPNNPAMITNDTGEVEITFGVNPVATVDTKWVIKRSTDLVNFTEIYSYDGPTGSSNPGADVTADVGATSITVTDKNPPAPRAFYKFGAEEL